MPEAIGQVGVTQTERGPQRPDSTDLLFFRREQAQTTGQQVFGWGGSWPPPSTLTLVEGGNGTAVVDPTDVSDLNVVSIYELESIGYVVTNYHLHSASAIAHSASPDEHWFRGAEYLPETTPPPALETTQEPS